MPAARRVAGAWPSEAARLAYRVAPEIVTRLLRSRPAALGEHFAMHWKALPQAAAGDSPNDSAVGAASAARSTGVLFLAVPKRQLARAVDRNLVRRIAREAWRAAGLACRPIAVFVRLRKRPDWFAAAGVRQKRRLLRAELDGLFADRSLGRAGR